MPNMQKVIKGFECCHVMVHNLGPDKSSCGICPYKDVQTEEQIDLGGIECIAVLHDDALALLKEQEEREKRICKDVCSFIRSGISTDTDVDQDYVCNEIQKIFCSFGRSVKWNEMD